MRKKKAMGIILAIGLLLWASSSHAHFGMVIPSDTMVMPGENRIIKVDFSFSHPFEGVGMELVKPKECGVVVRGKKKSLLGQLSQVKVMGHKAWTVQYPLKRPGVYQFYMVPKPYWEPAEDKFIVHYTKAVIGGFGNEEGWDEPIGFRTEIVPLSRPFGLYAGNAFQGIVMFEGKPVPFAEVEVEYYNYDGKAVAPTDYMITQVIRADKNGVFTYCAPAAGWWGFAALSTAPEKRKYNGKEKEVELGAVIWVFFNPWTVK